MAGGLGSTGDTAARKPKDKPNKLLSRFNREVYIRDTRSSHAGNLAAALLVLLAIIGLAFVASWKVLVPKIGALNEQLSAIATAPAETAALRAQIESKTTQQATAQARLGRVQAQLMSPEQSLGAITQFLASLRDGRVQLLSQKNTIGQTTANPYVAAGRAGAAKGAAAPAATAVVKPGLNYNHYELLLSGSYSGYIFARQTLVSMVPNLIIHYEDIGAMDQNPAQLSIRVYLSLPFLAK
jgi:hypothetical protein